MFSQRVSAHPHRVLLKKFPFALLVLHGHRNVQHSSAALCHSRRKQTLFPGGGWLQPLFGRTHDGRSYNKVW
eukprot:4118505-Alexandrium_andersonii.AAC.1